MNVLDFLNSSPQYSIFQKEANKTNFGGILFLLYIIIMIIISLAYIMDFALNDKYVIESDMVDTYLDSFGHNYEDSLQIIKDNPDINPNTDFTVEVELNCDGDVCYDETLNLSEISENLLLGYKGKFRKGQLMVNSWGTYIKFDINKEVFNIDRSSSNFITLVYKYNDTLHSNYPENIFLFAGITSKNVKISHNSSIPVSTSDCSLFYFTGYLGYCKHFAWGRIHNNESLLITTKISSLYYEEKKGISRLFDKIMNKTNKYIISFIETGQSESEYHSHIFYDFEYYEESGLGEEGSEEELLKYKLLVLFDTYPVGKYQIYKRSEVSFLTVLANIGSLFSTFFSVFSFIFKFYSKNFDNYKIVDKIILLELTNNKKNKIHQKNFQNKNIELSEVKFEKDNIISPLIDTFVDKDIDKEDDDKYKADSSNRLIVKEKEEDNYVKNEDNKEKIILKENQNKILPKLSFFDFYFNNIYFKCCKRRKKQEILELCNAIKLKYISIDWVLYNLIRLENLFKDYKWNNSELNNLENNELIKKLIKLI